MKRIIIPIMVVLIMMVGCQSKEISTEKVFGVMVDAYEEQRELTNKEKSLIEDWEDLTINLEINDLNHAVHAMYFNFYETLTTDDPINFNAAKSKAEQLID